MFFTKKEAAYGLADKGIALPDNWSKMTTDRAVAWATNMVASYEADKAGKKPPTKKVGLIAHGASAIMGAVAGVVSGVLDAGKNALELAATHDDAAPPLDEAARKNAVRKVYSDPTYVRSTTATRRLSAAYRREKYAADPVPMTRQVARRKALDEGLPASYFRHYMVA